jgi:hypothetical protein
MADGGAIDFDVFDKLKKGDKIHIIYPRGQNFVEKELLVKSKNLVGKGKSYESEKITFTDVSNPNGVNFFAYKRKSGFVGFAQGDSAMPYVQIKDKMADGGMMAKGGMSQGYDDREDERLAMKYGKIGSKDLDSTKARRDDARFEERGKMAKGGLIQHGLLIGDSIVGKKENGNIIIDNKGKSYEVNLNKGERINLIKYNHGGIMASGGEVIKEYEVEFTWDTSDDESRSVYIKANSEDEARRKASDRYKAYKEFKIIKVVDTASPYWHD